ncbi:hypothetical protein LTR94_035826, partial [Friedmanniomyces endolithicus]
MRGRRGWAIAALLLGGAPATGWAMPGATEDAVAADPQVRDNDDVIVNGVRERATGDAGAKTPTPLIALPQAVA